MPLALLAVVVGLVLLTVAADVFVAGAARLSAALNVPPVVIGAVVVGFGTSAPEMVVSAIASTQGKLDIAVGNIIGSNVANLTLVLGIAGAAVHDDRRLRRSCVGRRRCRSASVVLFAVLIQGGLERWEGVVLLVALVAALGYMFFGPSRRQRRAGQRGRRVPRRRRRHLACAGNRSAPCSAWWAWSPAPS